MKDKQAKYPQLRFKGFTDPWVQRNLGEVVDVKSGRDYKHLSEGDIPVYGTGGYMLSVDEALSQNDDAIGIGRKGTIDNPYLLRAPFWTVDTLFYAIPRVGFDLNFTFDIFQKVNWRKLDESTGVPSLSKATINSVSAAVPSEDEQIKIGGLFEKIDNLIAANQRKLDLLKEQKKGYLQKMFPKNGAKVPELRFAGFADDWEERKLSSGLREYTDRVIVEDDKEYYQISVRNNFGGITLRGSKMGNKIGRKRQAKINLTKYPQTLIFTRQTVEQGGIGWVDKYCDGAIVTENMPTISLDTSVFSKYFLTNLFQTRIFYKNAILDNVEGGSAQIAIHESKFLSSTLLFPNLDEQEKIGQFFKQLDNTIALHQRKLDLLKEQKKGYLQNMFV